MPPLSGGARVGACGDAPFLSQVSRSDTVAPSPMLEDRAREREQPSEAQQPEAGRGGTEITPI
eukprot:3385112-Prymnesium_polylepis.1